MRQNAALTRLAAIVVGYALAAVAAALVFLLLVSFVGNANFLDQGVLVLLAATVFLASIFGGFALPVAGLAIALAWYRGIARAAFYLASAAAAFAVPALLMLRKTHETNAADWALLAGALLASQVAGWIFWWVAGRRLGHSA